jgi:YD repeat-containing protein
MNWLKPAMMLLAIWSASNQAAAQLGPPTTYDESQLNPPTFVAIGVSPIAQDFTLSETDIIVGPEKSEGSVRFSRTYNSSLLWRSKHLGKGWYHNYDWTAKSNGRLVDNRISIRITNGQSTFEFIKQRTGITYGDPTLFKSRSGDNSRLLLTNEFAVDGNHPTLQLVMSDGTSIYISAMAVAGMGGSDCSANISYGCQNMIQMKTASGVVTRVIYERVTSNIPSDFVAGYVHRPLLIYNSQGFGLSFSYNAAITHYISAIQPVSVKSTGCAGGAPVCIDSPIGSPTTYQYSAQFQLLNANFAAGRSMIYGYESYVESAGPSGWDGMTIYRLKTVAKNSAGNVVLTNNYQPGNFPGSAMILSQTVPLSRTYTITRDWSFSGGHAGNNYDIRVTNTANETTVFRVTKITATWPTYSNILVPRILMMTDPLGRQTSYQYDTLARPTTTTFPRGNRVTLVFDGDGNVVSRLTYPVGSGAAFAQALSYASSGTGATTCYKMLSATDANNNITTFSYTASGLPEAVTSPADSAGQNPVTTTYYGAFQGVDGGSFFLPTSSVTRMDATRSITTSYEYDVGNHFFLKGIVVSGGGTVARTCRRYDPAGNIVSETKPNAALSSCP